MFNDQTTDEFVHVYKTMDGGFILAVKEPIVEMDRHELHIAKADFEISKAHTDLKTAKIMCEKMLELLGVKTYLSKERLGLMIEVVILDDHEKTTAH